jgi:hypothetical protein
MEFEELVFGDDAPACPGCGEKGGERLLSRPCRHKSSSSSRVGQAVSAPSGGGGCAGCSGGSCSTCR